MKPGVIHILCAYPIAIVWTLVAGGVNALVLTNLAQEFTWSALLLDVGMAARLSLLCTIVTIFCLIPAAVVYPIIAALCRKVNGGPYRRGDQVLVLAGKYRGVTAEVHKIMAGQGGQPLAELDLHEEHGGTFQALFEEYALLRMSPRLP